MDPTYDFQWLRNALKSPDLFHDVTVAVETVSTAAAGHTVPRDPEKLAYLRRLGAAIREGRRVTTTYNIVLIVVLVALACLHWREKWANSRIRAARSVRYSRRVTDVNEPKDELLEPPSASTSSSSSNSIQGTVTPSYSIENDHAATDLERIPLLSRTSSTRSRQNRPTRVAAAISSWLTYQPRPIPIINRTLPSNGTTLFVVAFLGLNAFYQFYRVPLELQYLFVFADRAGSVFIINLPLLYLLAAKNQPIQLLTGRSYESLNIFHRRIGELLCFEAVVHFAGMLIFRSFFAPPWLLPGSLWEFLGHRLVLLGIGAFVSYELLYLTSLGSFRQRCYELFLASHVVLQLAALVFMWFHFRTAKPYVAVSLAIFVLDRLVWRMTLKSTKLTADVTVLPDGDTLVLSANWDIPPRDARRRRWLSWPQRSVKRGWKPTDHVFLKVPILGRTHALQAHPFTIASAAPVPSSDGSAHAWLNLLIRAHSGFTTDLLHYAHRHRSVDVRLDGPYGSSHALDTLKSMDDVILVAGGSGIAVTFPVLWALLMNKGENLSDEPPLLKPESTPPISVTLQRRSRVHLLWVMHSHEHRFWIPSALMDDLVSAGLDLVMPGPTAVDGRPDVEGYLDSWIADTDSKNERVGVLVSGPDGLNRVVRNTCASALAQGNDIRLVVEKFGW